MLEGSVDVIFVSRVIHERPCLTTVLNTEKKIENTTRCGVVLTNFDTVFIV